MTGYYDYVLGLIPVALLGISGFLTLTGVSLSLAVPAGASVSVALIGHALFVNGPVATDPVTTEESVVPQSVQTPAANTPVNAD